MRRSTVHEEVQSARGSARGVPRMETLKPSSHPWQHVNAIMHSVRLEVGWVTGSLGGISPSTRSTVRLLSVDTKYVVQQLARLFERLPCMQSTPLSIINAAMPRSIIRHPIHAQSLDTTASINHYCSSFCPTRRYFPLPLPLASSPVTFDTMFPIHPPTPSPWPSSLLRMGFPS